MGSSNKYRFVNSKALGVPIDYVNPKFWIERATSPNSIIMTGQQIEAYNQSNYGNSLTQMVDLLHMEPLVEGHRLMAQLCQEPIPEETRYSFGRAVNENYYWPIVDRLNLYRIESKQGIGYGIVVDNAQVRTFPTAYESLRSPEEKDLDRFAESMLKIWEPVIILHGDEDNSWLYVQSRNYRGWVDSDYIAIVEEREDWERLIDPEDFLVVTGESIRLMYNPYNGITSERYLPMGTKLVLVLPAKAPKMLEEMSTAGNFIVQMPSRDDEGRFQAVYAMVSPGCDVNMGYLPYTIANVMEQGFKMLGTRYGWGGMYYGRDCSAFLYDIFSTFGIYLPRNSKQQQAISGETALFVGKGDSQRKALVRSLRPGSILYFSGHVMMYLGEMAGKHYAIHSVYSLGKMNSRGKVDEEKIASVVVTDLSYLRVNGKTLLESLEVAKTIK